MYIYINMYIYCFSCIHICWTNLMSSEMILYIFKIKSPLNYNLSVIFHCTKLWDLLIICRIRSDHANLTGHNSYWFFPSVTRNVLTRSPINCVIRKHTYDVETALFTKAHRGRVLTRPQIPFIPIVSHERAQKPNGRATDVYLFAIVLATDRKRSEPEPRPSCGGSGVGVVESTVVREEPSEKQQEE